VGCLREEAARGGRSRGVEPVLQRAGDEEEHAGDEAVRHHAEDGGVDATGVSVAMPSITKPCARRTRRRSAA